MRYLRLAALLLISAVAIGACATLGLRLPPWEADRTEVDAFRDYRSWERVNEEPVTGDEFGVLNGWFAAHGGERGFRDVYVNPVGADTSSGEAPLPYPEGTILVKETFRADDGEPGRLSNVTVMVKRDDAYDPEHANWEYINLNRNLRVRRQGAMRACYECHSAAEATDYVFTDNR